MHQMESKLIGLILTIGLVLCLAIPAISADYPTKPITMIIPWTAGGAADVSGRSFVNAVKKYLTQPIIVENKPGGGGTVGTSFVLTKPPDGYTIGAGPFSTSIVSYHMGKLDFNPVDDFTHIIRYTGNSYGLVVRADSPWKTIEDFISYAKANPQTVTCGIPGIGTTPHIAMEEFSSLAGIQLLLIPYKGVADNTTALLGGHVDALSDSSGWAPLVDAGKFRLLATYGNQRLGRYAQIRTLKEIGYDVVYDSPYEIYGPKGMPTPIVKKLHDAFKKAIDDPTYQATLQKLAMPALYLNSEDCKKDARQEFERTGRLVQKLGLQKK